MQVIPTNWLGQLQTRLAEVQEKNTAANKYPPGEKFENLWDQYVVACNDFISELETQYGSISGLEHFMQRDAEISAEPYGLVLSEYFNHSTREWGMPEGQENVAKVQMLQSFITYNYEGAKKHLERYIEKNPQSESSNVFKLGMG